MQKRISYYDIEWNRSEGHGGVRLGFDDRSHGDLENLTLQELGLLANLLRSEKPVFYDPEKQAFSTRADSVG
jgi:hypothetical protein